MKGAKGSSAEDQRDTLEVIVNQALLPDAIALAEAMFSAISTGSGTASLSAPDVVKVSGKELSVAASVTFTLK